VEQRLRQYATLISGEILDVGSKNRRYDALFSGRITAVDLVPDAAHGVTYGDITALPFEAESFDSVLAVEVLEYIRAGDFGRAIGEVLRVLKKGGYCFFSVPFLYAEHGDRIRPTLNYMREILGDQQVSEVSVVKIGNGYTVCWDISRRKILRLNTAFLKKVLLTLGIVCFRLGARLFRWDELEDDCYSGLCITVRK